MKKDISADHILIEIENISGGKIDLELWSKGDRLLALKTADWLAKKTNNTTAISTTHDGAILIDYALDGKLQPTVKVYSGRVVFPKGTDFNLMMEFLAQ